MCSINEEYDYQEQNQQHKRKSMNFNQPKITLLGLQITSLIWTTPSFHRLAQQGLPQGRHSNIQISQMFDQNQRRIKNVCKNLCMNVQSSDEVILLLRAFTVFIVIPFGAKWRLYHFEILTDRSKMLSNLIIYPRFDYFSIIGIKTHHYF